jgi:hypothetical protein
VNYHLQQQPATMNDYSPHHNYIPNENEEAAEAGDSSKIVRWRGNLVPVKQAKALRHVFDNMQDHFGFHRADPNVAFNLSLRRNNNTWNGDLSFVYTIDGEACDLAYIGIDICIDLAPKLLHKFGQQIFKDYGKSWVYAYMPDSIWEKIKEYVKAGTGWDVSDEGIIEDPNRNFVAIKANMHHQSEPKPSFWVASDDTDKDAMDASSTGENDAAAFSRIGSVQEVYHEQPSQQKIHRCVGIFAVSAEVAGSSNTIQPTPGMGGEARLSFTLVSIRSWGVTDCVAPIVFSKRNFW